MLIVLNFVMALIVSWAILYATYGLVVLAVQSAWWMVRFGCWFIVYAAVGVTLLAAYPVWRMVRAVARLGRGAGNVQSSRAGSQAAISHATAGPAAKRMMAPPTRRSSFPDVAISLREASEALFAYERRVLCARSEVRETAVRTHEIIAQTRALMARVDAAERVDIIRAETLLARDPRQMSYELRQRH